LIQSYLSPSSSLQTVWEVATSECRMKKFLCLFYSSCFTFRWTGSSDACKIALWRPSRCCGTELFISIRRNKAQNAACNDESRDKKVWVRDKRVVISYLKRGLENNLFQTVNRKHLCHVCCDISRCYLFVVFFSVPMHVPDAVCKC